MRCQRAWLLTIFIVLGVMAPSGCSTETRYHVLSRIFEDVPKPGEEATPKPVVRHPRRPPYEPAEKNKAIVKVTLPPPPPDWYGILRHLPKDEAGGIDWDRALEDQLIEPKPGIKPDAPNQPVFDLTLKLVPEGQDFFTVTFPHKQHTEWLACANCHTGIFKMQRGGDPITMAKIYAGEYCGRCHGKVSFAIPTGCPRCHRALAGPAK